MLSEKTSTRLVVAAIVLFVLFFGLSNWFRHVNLYTSQFDMGNMDQVLWHSLHGDWFGLNAPTQAGHMSRTAIHADFLLLTYLPFYALFPDPRTLLVLQVIIVASGAIPLFWLARKKLGPSIGTAIAVGYLLYPPLEWAMTFDVHAVVLAAPLLLWAWWAATVKRWVIYWIAVALALAAKEQVGLTVAAMGLYWIFRRGYRQMGIASTIIGIGWTSLMLGWAIPAARQNEVGHFALGYYQDFGGSYTDIIKNTLLQPTKTLSRFFSGQSFSLYGALLLPVGLTALAGLPVLLVALPELGINLLSNNPNQQTIFFQYMAVITPFIWLAAIDGLVRIRRWLPMWQVRWPQLPVRPAVQFGVAGLAIASVLFWSPLPGTKHHYDAIRVFITSPYRRDVIIVRQSLRPNDRVVITNNLGPQFSQREKVWSFPNDLDQADAIIVLEGGSYDLVKKEEVHATIMSLTTDPRFTLVHHHDLFWYFRKAI